MSSIDAMTTVGTGSLWQAGQSGDSRRAEFEARFKQAALAAGLDSTAADGLQDEIKAAVNAARQSAGSTTDRRQAMQQAIDGVLQKHGVDLDKFHELMQPPSGGPSGPGGAGGPPPGGPPDAGGSSRQADFQAKFTQAALASGLDSSEADSLQSEIEAAISSLLNSSSEQSDLREAIQAAVDSLLEKYGVDLDEFKSQLQSLASGNTLPLVDELA